MFSSFPSNLNAPCPQCGDQSSLDGVMSSCLECFLYGSDLYRFEYSVSPVFFLAKARGGTCTLASSDPPEDVLYRAKFLVEYGFGVYHLFKNNCEDFAIYCKTGLLVLRKISMGRSGQVLSFMSAATAASLPLYFLTSISGLAVAGCGMYCISRLAYEIGFRHNVMKIPVKRLTLTSPEAEPQPSAASEVAKED